MQYFGEIISIAVAVSWTFTALFFEFAGKRIGSLSVNLLRLVFAFFLLGGMLLITTGSFFPSEADGKTWLWMSLSGLVGFVFGDLCLFYSYTIITARFSQLLMTLAPPFAAFFGWILLGEKLSPMGFLGMAVTMFGIGMSILKRSVPRNGDSTAIAGTSHMAVVTSCEKENRSFVKKIMPDVELHLPMKGVLLGVGAALGQGFGIVLSKVGMNHYALSAEGTEISSYIPFAATHMRIISGVIGFALIIVLTGRIKMLRDGVKDRRAIGATFLGSIFGPFIGVSLSLLAVQNANTAVASTIMATTPIIILIPYIFIYKKKVTWIEAAGAVLSVVGVSLFFM